MDYEKAYKEALERAKKLYSQGTITESLSYCFPELQESKEENVRKALISFVNHDGWKFTRLTKEEKESWIAWLEKQGKQSNSSPIWKYKKDNKPLLHDSLILNKYGCVAKSPSGAIVSDVWVLDYDELAKLPKEKLEKQVQSTFEQCKLEGDRIITNSDGTHFNLSQLERVAKVETPEESLGISSEEYNKIVNECIFGAENKSRWTEEDEKYIDNCCLLIGAADDCYEKPFKDDCILYLQSLKERIAWKPIPIKQKDIDDLVFDFKWSSENFKNKRVTDIYRQGIYDVMELLKQRMEQ